MSRVARTAIAVVLIGAIAGWRMGSVAGQAAFDVYELADYRLTPEVFERFVDASRRVGDVLQMDSSFSYAPLFTKDVMLSGDAVSEASGLMTRLENHPGLAAALASAKMTPRDYAKFAIVLVAAYLANGFMKAGVLQRVPSGAPTINVEFVKTHESEVAETLARLGIT
ncbi:MAG TPA: hypothetical protein VKB50_12960 [Vicinamibacterales bacterium]|nr:hypothetical protein [Vicinamibacterales bacterium]